MKRKTEELNGLRYVVRRRYEKPQPHASIPYAIRVYNTLTKTKQPLEPVTPGRIGIYLCGPTVYDRAHIGHMVGPVIFDAIKRYLVYCGYEVTWVVNVTDVDDKLIDKAQQRGMTMAEVAEENTADYLSNLRGWELIRSISCPKRPRISMRSSALSRI
jgi:cysteinyl-tRNA synthetase